MEKVTYLFSSEKKNPDYFFQGYCFYKNHYIYGDSGGNEFLLDHGHAVPAGQDGCYVSVEKSAGIYKFKSDYHGYKKVFYYECGDVWIVSNSLYLIARHMNEIGVDLEPNYCELLALRSKGMFYQQPSSFYTIIKNVYLVPPNSILEVGGSYPLKVKKNRSSVNFSDYNKSLSFFIETWVSRLETILSNCNVFPTIDITGGVDSRAVFALYLMASKRLGGFHKTPRFNCGSISGEDKDLEVASFICEKYSLPLNKSNGEKYQKFSSDERISIWRDICLGNYGPVYFPKHRPRFDSVAFNGTGGGNHRVVYKEGSLYDDLDSLIDKLGSAVKNKWLSHEYKSNLRKGFDYICDNEEVLDNEGLMISHYKYFRNRFHAGLSSQFRVEFNPLGSLYLDLCSKSLSKEGKREAQINYDIIYSIDKDLLLIPYDENYKFPSDKVMSRLVDVPVKSSANPGKIYAGKIGDKKDRLLLPSEEPVETFEKYRDLFDRSLRNGFVKDFFDDDFILNARTIISSAADRKMFHHSIDAVPISNIITASIFFNS